MKKTRKRTRFDSRVKRVRVEVVKNGKRGFGVAWANVNPHLFEGLGEL